MDIKEILKQLEKEKEPLKYLQKIKKEIKDKKVLEQIEKLIESLSKKPEEKRAEAKIPSLEQIAGSVSVRRAPTETIQLENYQSRSRARIETPSAIPTQPAQAARQQGYNEDYGANVKSDYIRTRADFSNKLEASGFTSKKGFTTTAESKEAIRRQAGDRREYMEAGDNLNTNQYSEIDSFMQHQEDRQVMTFDLKQSKKGKRFTETTYDVK